jgi:hypothetical protein
MSPDDPRIVALAAAIVALIDGMRGDAPSHAHDDLVPLTHEALAERQLEHRAVVRLAESGELRTVKIGRRRYTRASWLADLAGKLAASAPTCRPVVSERDQLIALLRARRRPKVAS